MATQFDIGILITQEAGIHGGRPIIAETGVTVQRVVVWYKLGLIPEEIAERIGHLSLAQVYAALAYYHANREAVESEIAAEDTEYERLAHEHYLTEPDPR
jgi:uncharacterized protein (DUF433 family)